MAERTSRPDWTEVLAKWNGTPPGSDEAVAAGCACPRADNARGRGMYGLGKQWWLNRDCLLHGSHFTPHARPCQNPSAFWGSDDMGHGDKPHYVHAIKRADGFDTQCPDCNGTGQITCP